MEAFPTLEAEEKKEEAKIQPKPTAIPLDADYGGLDDRPGTAQVVGAKKAGGRKKGGNKPKGEALKVGFFWKCWF